MCVPGHGIRPKSFPNTDYEPYETLLKDPMPEVTPENPPVYPGRRFESRAYSLGLTLRDQVATDVLAYMISGSDDVGVQADSGGNRTLAMKAFAMADAFMEERNRNV